jgi:hypothetical protein
VEFTNANSSGSHQFKLAKKQKTLRDPGTLDSIVLVGTATLRSTSDVFFFFGERTRMVTAP